MTEFSWDNFEGVEVDNTEVKINWGVIEHKKEATFTVVEVQKGFTKPEAKCPNHPKVDLWLKFEGEDDNGEMVTYKGKFPATCLPLPLGNIDEDVKKNYKKSWSSFTKATGKVKQGENFSITPDFVDEYCKVGLTGKCTVTREPYSYIDKEGQTKTGFNNDLWYFLDAKKEDDKPKETPAPSNEESDFNFQ